MFSLHAQDFRNCQGRPLKANPDRLLATTCGTSRSSQGLQGSSNHHLSHQPHTSSPCSCTVILSCQRTNILKALLLYPTIVMQICNAGASYQGQRACRGRSERLQLLCSMLSTRCSVQDESFHWACPGGRDAHVRPCQGPSPSTAHMTSCIMLSNRCCPGQEASQGLCRTCIRPEAKGLLPSIAHMTACIKLSRRCSAGREIPQGLRRRQATARLCAAGLTPRPNALDCMMLSASHFAGQEVPQGLRRRQGGA